MYLDEAIKVIEMNLRSTCMMLETVKHNQIDKAIDYDWLPMQDHLAQCVHGVNICQESSVEDCLKYLGQLYKGLTQAWNHYQKGNRVLGALACDEAHMIDMLYGFIGHQFNEEYVACAREMVEAYKQTPIDPDEDKTDESAAKWRRKVLDKFCEILKKHDIDITENGEWSIREAYLVEWLDRKYWEN